MKPTMIFSWKAIALAPLAVPFLVGSTLTLTGGGNPVFSFLFFFALAAVLSYGVSIMGLLPCLYFCSRFVALTACSTGVMGALLGMATYFPVGWVSYRSSGVDSGPPSGTFVEYLWHSGPPEAWIFVAAGLVTALLYWFLAKPRTPLPSLEANS
jgi:hypothetical protein